MLIAASSLKLGTQHVQRAYVGLDLVYPISITPTPTPSLTPTLTPTPTPSLTPTLTPTPTQSQTLTPTPSLTPTFIPPTPTPTPDLTSTPTPTPSLTPTLTPTPTQSQTLTPTPTPTPTEIIGDYSSTIYEYNTTVTTLVTGMSILFSSTSEVSAVNETETVNQIIISGEQFNFTL